MARLLEGSLTALGFQTALAASPFGEQALLNLETVISMAQAADAGARQSLVEFADALLRAAEGEERDPREDAAHLARELRVPGESDAGLSIAWPLAAHASALR